MNLRQLLKGTGTAIVTPFNQQDVDYASLEALIEFNISNGVEYIVTLGTTGETPTLSKEEKKQVAKFTVEKVNGRVPIVIGIGGNNSKEIANQLLHDDLSDYSAILSVSPYYNKPSQQGIYEHYKLLADHSPKPIILYNVPGRTGSNISAETTIRLARDCEKIGGIKEASGNLVQCMHILADRPDDFLVVSGDDHIALPLIACGGEGVISVIANCFPADFSELIRMALRNDFPGAQKLQYKLLDAIDHLFAENNPAGVKCFLAEMGLIKNEFRLPVVPVSEFLHNKITSFLKNYKS
ncbi:MAG TPA: 4-hydroxy-tetrahydrodipicolinate synthase [Ginsengibacter sp.]|nr:4-hydroxy-tetrahydrodipicolinate synthase [Ginsengibacter sp.]HRP43181.1 4-hydroxy-tetrahydrodipicolinate synthase [Ginsengibacter sp.]